MYLSNRSLIFQLHECDFQKLQVLLKSRDYCQRYRLKEPNIGSVEEKTDDIIESRLKERGTK